ncbi:beta-glucosidase BglX [Enterococcus sp. HY326]|uniref:beta-glucosidase BglX n=1 Tax=Enterococcus sp. HY326 TaxID=2971265 RepID=UPI00223EB839|nr:beta-glucosidase BglX [Enterococcus sp. HY326]
MQEKQLQTLLDSLTWTEKVGQLIQLSGEFFNTEGMAVGPQQKLGISDEILANVGSVLNVTGAEKTKEIQERFLSQSTHKIPLLFMADIIYGYRTIFPIPLGLGATWNPELIESAYQVLGKEARSGGAHVTFAPMVDLVRDARWGRCLESTGEDPLLNSHFARSMVNGIQHQFDSMGIASCIKHFAAYGAAEAGREYNTVDMSERRLREDYLPSYQAGVDAGAKMVMTSFNTYDGMPVTGNEFLLKNVLRDEWGFDGVIISDYAAVKELIDHGVAKDNFEATTLAMQATNDIDMKSPCYATALLPLIKDGKIDEELVNQAVYRVLKLKNDLGLFEDATRGASAAKETELLLHDSHRQLAKQVSSEAMVLLENKNQLLPLTPNQDKVLLVGPYGDNQELIGLWAVHGKTQDTVSILSGLKNYLDDEHLSFEKGSDMLDSYDFLGEFGAPKEMIDSLKMTPEAQAEALEKAVTLGEKADVIIYALGEHTMQSGEAGSRTDLRLPDVQRRFLKKMIALGKKNILIAISGRPLILTEEQRQMDAIIAAWFPGTEGGSALADIIFGKVNPSGRLSMSFPYTVGQLPIYYNGFKTGRPATTSNHSGRFVSKYLDAPNEPLYPFGYGLSYHQSQLSELTLSETEMTDSLTISLEVSNLSQVAGTDTIQLYIQDVVGSVVRPVKELKQFKKITLAGHETKTISFTLTRDELRFYTKSMAFAAEPGEFLIFVENGQQQVTAKFDLI